MCTQCLPSVEAAEGDDAQIADAGGDLLRHRLRQRLHDRVGELVAGTEARDHRRREDRDWPGMPFGATILIGRVRPLFCGMLP